MLKINGTGEGMSGRAHPDGQVEDIYCDNCKKATPFQKMLGVKKNYIFWIPLPTQEKDKVYWQCNKCKSFIRFGDVGAKHYIIEGANGGVMRDLTTRERNDNLRRLIDFPQMGKKR